MQESQHLIWTLVLSLGGTRASGNRESIGLPNAAEEHLPQKETEKQGSCHK